MMNRLLRLLELREMSAPVGTQIYEQRNKEFESIMACYETKDLYEDLLELKKERYPLDRIFSALEVVRIHVGIIGRYEGVGADRKKSKLSLAWKCFCLFIGDFDVFAKKRIPVHEWQDLGEKVIDLTLVLLKKPVQNVFKDDRYDEIRTEWTKRFFELAEQKGYKNLLVTGY